MIETLLSRETDIESAVVEELRKFNIRTVEQLLEYRRQPRRIEMLSRALHLSVPALVTMLNKLARNHQDKEPKRIKFTPHPLGLRIAGEPD